MVEKIQINEWAKDLKKINARIIRADIAGIMARWDFGEFIQKIYEAEGGGVWFRELAEILGTNYTELMDRRKFAELCPERTKAEQIAREYGNWTMVRKAYFSGITMEEAAYRKSRVPSEIERRRRARATVTVQIPERIVNGLKGDSARARDEILEFLDNIDAEFIRSVNRESRRKAN
jgi:hypothetical protein